MAKLELVLEDFEKVVSIGTSWFGRPKTTRAIVAVISPRMGGAEWGYKRGALWVTGDGFAQYLLDNDWTAQGLKKSLAAHETIHSWFGESVVFEHAYHAEAITQYVEVVLTAELFGQADLARQYFDSYRTRFAETMAMQDVPISSLTVDQNTYDYWYLKGSWAFWDLEALVGRSALLKALAGLHSNASGKSVSSTELATHFSRSLKSDLGPFFTHWFDSKGFEPLYRTGANDDVRQ
jgi:aminopeptidase N